MLGEAVDGGVSAATSQLLQGGALFTHDKRVRTEVEIEVPVLIATAFHRAGGQVTEIFQSDGDFYRRPQTLI